MSASILVLSSLTESSTLRTTSTHSTISPMRYHVPSRPEPIAPTSVYARIVSASMMISGVAQRSPIKTTLKKRMRNQRYLCTKSAASSKPRSGALEWKTFLSPWTKSTTSSLQSE